MTQNNRETSDIPNCRANEALQIKKDRDVMHDSKRNMSNYFNFNTNGVADKRASEMLANKIHNEFSDFFSEIGAFTLQIKEGSWLYQPFLTPERRTREAKKTSSDSSDRL